MINAIHQHLYTPAPRATTPAAAAAADSTSTSTTAGFQDELGSQFSFADFQAVFGGASSHAAQPAVTTPAAASTSNASTTTEAPVAPTDPAASTVPTAQSVFGDQPWMDNPQGTGPDNSSWSYNPIYFASEATAQKVADLVGGKVIQQEAMTPAPGSPLQQSQMNEMVQLKDGTVVNPGLIADFYDHGYSQTFVDQMIKNEIQGVQS